MRDGYVVVMGSYVADVAFRTEKLPAWGETHMGTGFKLGPGGKGSNQAVAAARAGAQVSFISKLGRDAFGDIARTLYREEGIETAYVFETDSATGAAAIIIDAVKGENAIIVVPGACFELTPPEVEKGSGVDWGCGDLRYPAGTFAANGRVRSEAGAYARCANDPQSSARLQAAGFDLSILRLHDTERIRGRGPDRHSRGFA